MKNKFWELYLLLRKIVCITTLDTLTLDTHRLLEIYIVTPGSCIPEMHSLRAPSHADATLAEMKKTSLLENTDLFIIPKSTERGRARPSRPTARSKLIYKHSRFS